MEQTWFDLPVESRLTEVWPKGLLKKSKMIPHACKPAEMSFPMPYWNLPVVPMDQKMPLLPGPKDLYHLARSKLGEKLWGCEDSEFSLNEFIQKEIFNAYEILHDPNLAHFLRRPKIVRRLKELGLVDSQLGVMCNLRDYNYYRRYLAFVHNNAINKLYKEQFSKGDNNLEVAALTVNLEKQNAKARVDEEIEQRHAEVFKEILAEKKKKDAVCQKRLRRVEEVFQRKQSNREARRIAAREAAKDFTRKVKENLYYANAQLRQHKLDTMRKWRKQNTEKTALFEEMKKKKQEDSVNKKTEWFQNKIKHQEKRVLQETQINVLMDHEFSPEYKRYLKYIKRENYKNPPAQAAGPEYRVSSESEVEDTDLLNQLRLFTKAGYQLQRGSFISRVQARQSVAKLANLTIKPGSYAQVRQMSEKFMKEKQNMKNKKRQSVLDALINSSILRLLSPSLQDVFKKSDSKWKNKKQKAGKVDKIEPDDPSKRSSAASNKLPTLVEVVNVDDDANLPRKSLEESLKEDEDEDEEAGGIGLGRDSEIEIRPPNKTIPPPPICHLNVYRYFDRVIGKVILEYVTRILLPKFPEIINRCHWVSKAEGLPEDSDISQEKPPCHPEDSRQSYTECMELMRDSCDKKMACYLLLLSESPDIRLFRHKFNGIGEITCPESLVGNFLVQSSPHPQHILDYIHWRANWILNYPPPKTYQEIYDLKYVIGVMKKIECPVFQPIYKLWEITNDINLNPEVLDKFVLHMEKKKEQKPTVELNPVEIAVKNVRKIIGPLTMDYKITKEVDDYCLKDIFKVPSELFRMSYLKKPVDPRIWKILDELLDKTKRRPEDLECLRCLPDKLKQKLSQIEDFEEIEQTAAESLFIDSRDYTEEVKKAKDKDRDETTDSPHIRFGITEFIPYVEAQLFGKEKGYYVAPEAEEDSLDKGAKDKMRKKKPSILRFSRSSLRERRKSSRLQKRDSSRGSRISHQRKETNLAAKMHSSSVEGRKSQGGKNKSVMDKDDAQNKGGKAEPAQEKEKSTAGKEPKANVEQEETQDEDEGSDVTAEHEAPEETKVDKKEKAAKPEKTAKSAKPSSKDGKDKKKKGKDKKPENKPKSTAKENTKPTSTDNEGEESEDDLALKKGAVVRESKIKFKDDDEEKSKREKVKIAEPEKDTITRSKSLSIMKSPETTLNVKTDLNVKFTSKKYVDPHILKTLEVTDDLKKSKDRAPTPHPSFTSIPEEMQTPKKLLEEAKKHEELSNILKYKECAKEPESDNVLTEMPLFPRRTSETNIRHHTTDTVPRIEELTKLKKTSVTPDTATEVVLNVIQPDIAEGLEREIVEEEKSFSSIGSDIEHLRKFVSSKLPHKLILQEKSYDEESGTEAVPVPPIINKSLLTRRRIIKRPLANILRKIYGWVMTTVIRRRLLISYGLPPKIRKECFYKKKFDSNNLDLARGLAKLILEEPSEFYPFAVLEPYIETILEQTMDPSKRFNFTKRVVRMAQPLKEENLDSLKQFLKETEKDSFYKKARTRRLKKFTMCLRMRPESIHNYRLLWGSNHFDPREWEDIFSGPKLEDLSYMCTKRKFIKKKRKSLIQQQKSAFVSYGGDSPDPSVSSSSSSEEEDPQKKGAKEERGSKTMSRSERAASRKSREVSMWLKENVVKKDSYDEWRPGFTEKRITSRQKVLDIVINKVADVAPSITEINDEMRHDFSHHKVQRRWMEKERQFRFITNLNMFGPILPPKGQDRKLMKFVQSENYPYVGTFLTCQTYSERRYQPPVQAEPPKTPKSKRVN